MNDTLDICKATRNIAEETLSATLKDLLESKKPISEVNLRDQWLTKLKKHKEIFPEGWYSPPPHGIGVLFATDKNPQRVKFKSLRQEEYWPKDDIFLDRENGFVMVYASPVNKSSGLIGDFGMNIYFGKDEHIKQSLKKELEVVEKIFHHAQVGMEISEIHNFAKNILNQNGLTNEWWTSTTDPTGTNYGHTIPGTFEPWTQQEQKTLKEGDRNWDQVIKTISSKRLFVNASEKTKIMPGTAFTIEPRVIAEHYPQKPTIYFHTIAMFKENGGKELLTGFDTIFKTVRMDYMLL